MMYCCRRSNWFGNPYTRGSYSYIPVDSDVKHIHTLTEIIHSSNNVSARILEDFYSTKSQNVIY